MFEVVRNKFGDGISWENFAREALEESDMDSSLLFFKYGQDKKKDEIIDRIGKYISLDDDGRIRKLLDVGCNIGRWIDILKKFGMDYYGVYQSEEVVRIAMKYHPTELFFVSFCGICHSRMNLI